MRPEIPERMASGATQQGELSLGDWRSRVQDPVSKEAVEGPRGKKAGQYLCQIRGVQAHP